MQGRPALADEQIAEQRRADRVGESRRRRSQRVGRVAPARGIARTRARQQRAREERPADEVVARRRHAGAKAEQRRRGLGRAGRVVGGTRARERVGAPAGGLQRERAWRPGEPAAEATR